MKFVLNKAYGGFTFPAELVVSTKWDEDGEWKDENGYWHEIERNDPDLVSYVEQYPEKVPDLKVVKIEGEVTDCEITEYDGFESLIYVVDGKIHHA